MLSSKSLNVNIHFLTVKTVSLSEWHDCYLAVLSNYVSTASCPKLPFRLRASVNALTCSDLRCWCSLMMGNHWLSMSDPLHQVDEEGFSLTPATLSGLTGVLNPPVRCVCVLTCSGPCQCRWHTPFWNLAWVCASIKQTWWPQIQPTSHQVRFHPCLPYLGEDMLGWEHRLVFLDQQIAKRLLPQNTSCSSLLGI